MKQILTTLIIAFITTGNAFTQQPRLVIPTGHFMPVIDISFSPDSRFILSASEDRTAKVWSLLSGDLLLDLKASKDEDESMITAAFSPSGKLIITVATDSIIIWHAFTGKHIKGIRLGLDDEKPAKNFYFISEDRFRADDRILDLKTYTFSKLTKIVPPARPGALEIVDSTLLSSIEDWYKTNGMENLLSRESEAILPGILSAYYSPDKQNIISTIDETIAEWDLATGKLVCTMQAHSATIWSVQFSADGKKFVTASGDGIARVWDVKECRLQAALQCYSGKYFIWTAAFSPDATKIITAPYQDVADGDDDNKVRLWDIDKKKMLFEKEGFCNRIQNSAFSPDGKYVVVPTEEDTISMWNVATGKRKLKLFVDGPLTAQYSPDGSKILVVGISQVKILDASNYKRLTTLSMSATSGDDGIHTAYFSPDGKKVIVIVMEGSSGIWDAVTGKPIDSGKAYEKPLEEPLFLWTANFSPDMKKLFIGDKTVWDEESGKKLYELQGPAEGITGAAFSPTSQRLITTSYDNSCRMWDANNGRLILTFLSIDSAKYLVQEASGYYMGLPEATRQINYVTKSLNIISFEQLDIKYNRPDRVLSLMEETDPYLLQAYHKAWEKRMKRLRIDTTLFNENYSIPVCDIINSKQILYDQKQESLILKVKAKDSLFKLRNFNVWINEVPVFGQRGFNLSDRKKSNFDTTLTIRITPGKNKIEASVINNNGIESYRIPLTVNYTPSGTIKSKTYFIGIGIDKFSDSIYNLSYSSKDIRDLSDALKTKYGTELISLTLFNQDVTIEKIKEFKKQLMQSGINDKIIIAYSGHGLLSDSLDYYLSTFDINFQKPEEKGLPYDELEILLDSIPARKKLMLIDACHSGEVDKEEGIAQDRAADSLGLKKGIIIESTRTSSNLGLKSSFELMQSLFVNVSKSTGTTIISAAAGNQFALERGDLKNGVFTYSLLEALNKYPSIKISELKKIVGERVEQLTNGMQKPTSRNETITVDWDVW